MTAGTQDPPQFDVIVIGAGLSGLYSLYQVRQRGYSSQILETGGGVGGTWYWCCYPGARFDSESFTYAYSFSDELVEEWDWKEYFSGQPENERYYNHVCDKFGLRPHIRFNSDVRRMQFLEDENLWEIETDDNYRVRARFVIAAVGVLSASYVPDFPGLNDFRGTWLHTGRWPRLGLDLKDKRVGVVGTGATGVQLIPAIADEVAHLTVFQRTANYCLPLRNGPIDPENQVQLKANHREIFDLCRKSPLGFPYVFDERSAFDVSEAERVHQYERLWHEGGFKKYLANFHDVVKPGPANQDYAAFVREKIRQRVQDPAIAELLIPKDHPFGSKRVPFESGYYEVFNRENVSLVDVKNAPIVAVTDRGISTTSQEYPLDVIIFATGYDAVTGSLTRIEIRGEGGLTMNTKYAEGLRTYFGLQSAGFPNLFFANQGAGNVPRITESIIDWITDCISYVFDHGFQYIAPTEDAEDEWTKYILQSVGNTLRFDADSSWLVGSNIPGKPKFPVLVPIPAPEMQEKRAAVVAAGYKGFELH